MPYSDDIYTDMRTQLVDRVGLTLSDEGWNIVRSVWDQTIGRYLDTEADNGRYPWDNDRRFRMFVRKWAFFVAGEIQQSAVNPTSSDVDLASRRALRLAHEECTAMIAAGATPLDPRAFAESGPFCTAFLSGGA